MGWQEQSEDLFKTWTGTQQKLLSEWIDAVRGLSGTPGTAVWTKTVDAWQSSVKQTLDAQTEWAGRWTNSLAGTTGTPQEMHDLAVQGQAMLQRWTEAQKELWQTWFDVLKSLNIASTSNAGVQASQNLAQSLNDSVLKMIDAQAEWVRRWTVAMTGGE
jgi:hypothetical protein